MIHYDPAHDPKITNGIQEAYGFKRGDLVEYIKNGCIIGLHIIVGFVQNPNRDCVTGHTIYINNNSFPVKPSDLIKIKNTDSREKSDILMTRKAQDLTSKLFKPCPFCGGKEIVFEEYEHSCGLRWRIVCMNCMAMIDPGWARRMCDLIGLWNYRP